MTDTRGRLDKALARELELYTDNDSQIYRSRITPIKDNLRKKIAKGVFDYNRSVDLWMYAVEDGAKKYFKEFGSRDPESSFGRMRWNDMFSRPTRLFVAKRMALQFMDEEGLKVPKSAWDQLDLEN